MHRLLVFWSVIAVGVAGCFAMGCGRADEPTAKQSQVDDAQVAASAGELASSDDLLIDNEVQPALASMVAIVDFWVAHQGDAALSAEDERTLIGLFRAIPVESSRPVHAMRDGEETIGLADGVVELATSDWTTALLASSETATALLGAGRNTDAAVIGAGMIRAGVLLRDVEHQRASIYDLSVWAHFTEGATILQQAWSAAGDPRAVRAGALLVEVQAIGSARVEERRDRLQE